MSLNLCSFGMKDYISFAFVQSDASEPMFCGIVDQAVHQFSGSALPIVRLIQWCLDRVPCFGLG